MKYLALFILLACSSFVNAQGKSSQLAVGVWVDGVSEFVACDTEEQMSSVLSAHIQKGLEAAQEVWAALNATPGNGGKACGSLRAYIMVTRVIWTGTLEGKPAAFVELAAITQNGPYPLPLYSVLFGAEIVDPAVLGARPS